MGLVQLIRPGSGGVWGSGTWGSGTWGGGDTVYTLPPGLALKENSFEARIEKSKLAFSHGRFSTGGEIDDRGPVLEGLVEADTRSELRQLLNEMRVQCQRASRLRIDSGSFLPLTRLARFEDEPERGFDWEVSRLRIEWQCDDPFWRSETETVVNISVSGDGTFAVDLTGLPACEQGQHPQIIISSPLFLPVATFKLTNNSDEGLSLRYGDPYLGFGTSATIDCVAGTAARSDGQNTIRYLEGEFLRLVDGVNSFAYEGPACQIQFKWRHRWL